VHACAIGVAPFRCVRSTQPAVCIGNGCDCDVRFADTGCSQFGNMIRTTLTFGASAEESDRDRDGNERSQVPLLAVV